ncbi:MAG TPA: CHASE4 domain-containing protein [Dehalococcoidales bacterium]|nr:CHASE4 domain-containing protein [Dehalococcoidales bacterium]
MTLRRKTLLIIAGTFYGVIILLFFISRNILLESYADLERRSTHRDVERVLAAYSYGLSELETTAADWAAWDDTYVFIADHNEDYIRSNLTDSTFTQLGLSLMLYIDSSRQITFGKAFDLENEEEIPLPPGISAYLTEHSFLVSHRDAESSYAGTIVLPEGPMLIASHPILPSEDEGPIRGTLIMGRYLDAAKVNELADITLLSITIHKFNDPQAPPDFFVARSSISTASPVFVQPLSEQSIAGYKFINNIDGHPALILRVDAHRDIYHQGQSAISYLILSIVGVSLAFGLVTLLLLEKQVLSRLSYLSRSVSDIGTGGKLTARVSVPGSDELAKLGATINGMLGALEQSETELRESEEHYRLLAEHATDVIYVMDVNLKFTYVSPSVTRLTGHSVEEAVSLSPNQVLTPASFNHARDIFTEEATRESEATKDLTRSRTLELEVKRKDGSIVWVEATMTALRDSADNVIGILGVARDIAERKKAEAKLQELYKAERKLREDLEAEINKRVEFTHALVHELKTPITPVLASSELMLEEIKGGGPLWELAQNINQGAYNLNQRIDELLDLARGEVGMLRLNPESVDSGQLLRNIVDSVKPLARKNGHLLHAELPPSLPVIQADEDRLRQVVLNLLNNAFKFTPAGGSITVRARKKEAHLMVEIEDTGRGISQEEQKRLFEPYQQLEVERTRLSGLGLGLSLSKKLVELHGGQIWVQSEKGQGSTFGFSIPLEARKQAESPVKR